MKERSNSDSSNDESSTNSFVSDVSPEFDFSLTGRRNADLTVSSGKDLSVIPESLKITGFRILRLLGRGGMGVVYEAVEEELHRHVALKVLPASALVDHRQVARFKNEARAVAQLHHENIVPIYKVGSDQGIHYYTMQLIEGQNLSQIITSIKEHKKTGSTGKASDTKRPTVVSKSKQDRRREEKSQGWGSNGSSRKRFKIEELAEALSSRRGGSHELTTYQAVAEFGAEIAVALAHAHECGVIHRDIKPSNILVDENSKPWVTDFGLAMVVQNSVATRPGDIVGTYRYMSPEQATGRRFLIDHRTDIYSLGVTLYELVTQTVPFPGVEPHEILRQVSFDEPRSVRSANPAIPEELEIIITKAIAKNPHDRYESAQEMADDLRRFATGRPINAKRASVMKRTRRWIGQHQGIVLAASIILLVTLVSSISASAMIWTAYKSEHEQRGVAEKALNYSEGMRLAARSQQVLDENPGLALGLGVEGGKQASGSEINSAIINALSQTYERKTLFPPNLRARTVQISPDGQRIAALRESPNQGRSSAVIIDSGSGSLVQELGENEKLTGLLFHPSSNKLLTASSSGIQRDDAGNYYHRSENATLWDLRRADGKVVLEGSTAPDLQSVCFSRDGKLLVLPSAENTVSVYDGTSGERKLVFAEHKAQVISAVVCAEASSVASLDSLGEILVWNPASGMLQCKVDASKYLNGNPAIALNADGRLLIISTRNGTHSFDVSQPNSNKLANWRESRVTVHPSNAVAACFGFASGEIRIRNLKTGQPLAQVSVDNAVDQVMYSEDGKYLMISAHNRALIFEPYASELIFQLKGHSGKIVALSADSSFNSIVTASVDRTVRIWGTSPLSDFSSLPRRPETPIPTRDHWVATEQSMAMATDSVRETFVMDVANGRLRRISSGGHGPGALRGRNVLVFQDQFVRVIDSDNSRKMAEVAFPKSKVVKAAYCGESPLVLIQLQSDQWFVWNTEDQSLRNFSPGRRNLIDYAISPDAQQIVLIGGDGLCTVHDLADGKVVRLLPHSDLVVAVEWSKSSGIFTLDAEGVLHRWSVEVDRTKPMWTTKTDGANALLIHEATGTVVTYNDVDQKKVLVWKLDSGEELFSFVGSNLASLAKHPTEPFVLMTSIVDGASVLNLVSGEVTALTKSRSIAGGFLDKEIVVAEVGVEQHALKSPTFLRSDSGTCSIAFFDRENGKQKNSIPLNRKPSELTIDRENGNVLLSFDSWYAAIYDRKTKTEYLSPPLSANVAVIRHLPKGNQWLVASSDGSILLLDSSGKLIRSIVEPGKPITCVEVTQDNSKFMVGDLAGNIQVYDIATGAVQFSAWTHDSPVVQGVFWGNDRSVLSLSESGDMVLTSLVGEQPLKYVGDAGVQLFRIFPDQSQALLICGSDRLIKPIGDGSSSIGSIAVNSQRAKAEVISLKDFSVSQLDLPSVVCGDANSENSRMALVDENGVVSICTAEPWEVQSQWNITPRKAVSLRWIDKRRIAILSDLGTVSIWDAEAKQLVIETKAEGIRILHLAFRKQWNPFDSFANAVVLTGANQLFYEQPLDVFEFGQRNMPRALEPNEKQLHFNPQLNFQVQ